MTMNRLSMTAFKDDDCHHVCIDTYGSRSGLAEPIHYEGSSRKVLWLELCVSNVCTGL